jgi:hypothetical protein
VDFPTNGERSEKSVRLQRVTSAWYPISRSSRSSCVGSVPGPRSTDMTPTERGYDRSLPRTSSVGFEMPVWVQLKRDPL